MLDDIIRADDLPPASVSMRLAKVLSMQRQTDSLSLLADYLRTKSHGQCTAVDDVFIGHCMERKLFQLARDKIVLMQRQGADVSSLLVLMFEYLSFNQIASGIVHSASLIDDSVSQTHILDILRHCSRCCDLSAFGAVYRAYVDRFQTDSVSFCSYIAALSSCSEYIPFNKMVAILEKKGICLDSKLLSALVKYYGSLGRTTDLDQMAKADIWGAFCGAKLDNDTMKEMCTFALKRNDIFLVERLLHGNGDSYILRKYAQHLIDSDAAKWAALCDSIDCPKRLRAILLAAHSRNMHSAVLQLAKRYWDILVVSDDKLIAIVLKYAVRHDAEFSTRLKDIIGSRKDGNYFSLRASLEYAMSSLDDSGVCAIVQSLARKEEQIEGDLFLECALYLFSRGNMQFFGILMGLVVHQPSYWVEMGHLFNHMSASGDCLPYLDCILLEMTSSGYLPPAIFFRTYVQTCLRHGHYVHGMRMLSFCTSLSFEFVHQDALQTLGPDTKREHWRFLQSTVPPASKQDAECPPNGAAALPTVPLPSADGETRLDPHASGNLGGLLERGDHLEIAQALRSNSIQVDYSAICQVLFHFVSLGDAPRTDKILRLMLNFDWRPPDDAAVRFITSIAASDRDAIRLLREYEANGFDYQGILEQILLKGDKLEAERIFNSVFEAGLLVSDPLLEYRREMAAGGEW